MNIRTIGLVSTALFVAGCGDTRSLPVELEPGSEPEVEAAELAEGLNLSSGAASPLDALAPSLNTTATTTMSHQLVRTTTETLATIFFEGPRNEDASLPKTARVSFPGWVALIDEDAGGSGNFANEPSASTALFWEGPSPSHYYRDIFLDQPVAEVSLYYAACLNCGRNLRPPIILPFSHITIIGYNAAGAVVDSVTGAHNYNTSTGDPKGNWNAWDKKTVRATEADNQITRVRVTGYSNWMGIDDFHYRQINFRPVSRPGGPYSVPEGSPVSFDGSVSYDPVDASGLPHPNGDALVGYTWDFGDGNVGTGAKPSHTYASSGTYTATLTVSDPNGLSHSETTTVTIENVPPTVNAGADATVPIGSSFTLAASFSDPGGSDDSPWGYTVDWGDDQADDTGTISDQSTPITPSHTYASPGTYTVTVYVQDRNGGTGSDVLTVQVQNQPPTAAFTVSGTPTEGSTLTFSSTSTDPEGQALTHAWTIGGTGETGTSPSRTFDDDGSYEVSLTVTDPWGGSDTEVVTLSIANVAPTATFTHSAAVDEGDAFSLTLSGAADPSAADLAAGLEFAFDCGSGFGAFASATSVSCGTSDDGTLAVGGRVRDKDGGVTTYTGSVTVTDVPPSVSVADGTVVEDETFSLSGGFSDPAVADAPWAWTVAWGDGQTSSGSIGSAGWAATMSVAPTHVYADPGTYVVTLTVTDVDGVTASATATVIVTPANTAPTADAGGPYAAVEGSPVTLSGSGSSDPDGDALTYEWNFGDGSPPATGVQVTHTYADDDDYTVTLTVTDEHGLAGAPATAVVSVSNDPPVLSMGGAAIIPVNVGWSRTVSFTDAGDDQWTATVDYGDGSGPATFALTGRAVPLSHTYSAGGAYVVTVTVTDDDGASDTGTIEVRVNTTPVALAAVSSALVECTTPSGSPVQLDGSGSFDDDGDPLAYLWTNATGQTIATTANPTVTLPVGTHVLTVRVTDPFGAFDTDVVTVTVQDTQAPTVTLSASPGNLWPPNHKYHEITVSAAVADACTAPSELNGSVAAFVVSNEPDESPNRGDGNTTGDIRVTRPGGSVLLSSNSSPQVQYRPGDGLEVRAERLGNAAPRHYTITLTATDSGGRTTTSTTVVTVDHDQGGNRNR